MNLQKKLIFKKFRTKRIISSTSSSYVYEGVNELTEEQVAMKFEKIAGKYNLLESEAYFLYILKGFGIPKLISYGQFSMFNVLIEELLGTSLYQLWTEKKNINIKLKITDICLTALQCLDRLEHVHSKNIIHRDIKPYNFMLGRKDPDVIYLIDFGIVKKFRSSRTGKHIKFSLLKSVNGSIRYMSLNASRGYEQSRRDDLESLGYMLIFLAKNSLPWMTVEKLKLNNLDKCKKVYNIKKSTKLETLCEGLPEEFPKYIKYCRDMEFEQEPDYNYLRGLFISAMQKTESFNHAKYSLIKANKLKNIKENDLISYDNRFYSKRIFNGSNSKNKDNAHKRLYRQIKESIEKAKSQEIPNLKSVNFFRFGMNKINKVINNINSINAAKNNNNINKQENRLTDNQKNNCKIIEEFNNSSRNNLYHNFKIKKIEAKTNLTNQIIFVKPKIIDINSKIRVNKQKSNDDEFIMNESIPSKSNYINFNNNNLLDASLKTEFSPKISVKRYRTQREREKLKIKSIKQINFIKNNINNISSRNNLFINDITSNKQRKKRFHIKDIILHNGRTDLTMSGIQSEEKDHYIINHQNTTTSRKKYFNNKIILNRTNDCFKSPKMLLGLRPSSRIRIDKNYNINIINN